MLYENYLRKKCYFLTSPCPLGEMSTCSQTAPDRNHRPAPALPGPLSSLTVASGVLRMVWVPKKAQALVSEAPGHSIWACEQRKAQTPR